MEQDDESTVEQESRELLHSYLLDKTSIKKIQNRVGEAVVMYSDKLRDLFINKTSSQNENEVYTKESVCTFLSYYFLSVPSILSKIDDSLSRSEALLTDFSEYILGLWLVLFHEKRQDKEWLDVCVLFSIFSYELSNPLPGCRRKRTSLSDRVINQ